MAGMIGADVEALERLAADFGSGANELRELSQQLSRSIDEAHDWQGPDATRCKDEWGTFAHTQMTGVADALATAGRLLQQNAQEQEKASGADTGTSKAGDYGIMKILGDVFDFGKWAKKLNSAFGKAKTLVTFISQLITKNLAELAESEQIIAALKKLTGETPGTLAKWLEKLHLGIVGKVLGKIALPMTVWDGLKDFWTGGKDSVTGQGYEGWRKWATQGFGLVGAAGAGTLIGGALVFGGAAAMVAAAPVTAAVAGVAVTAYGLWSAGNYLYDHRQAIGTFVKDVWHGVGPTVTHGLDAAKSWARGLLGGLTPSFAGI